MKLKNATYHDLWKGDFDKDGVPNIDDTRPFNRNIKRKVNKENMLSDKYNGLRYREKTYRKDINELSKLIGAKKGRVKRTYSTLGKQMGRYLDNVKDMGGVRILTKNKRENDKYLNKIKDQFPRCRKKTKKNCIFEIENKYDESKKKKNELPYLGYHVGVRYKGLPYEVQIKCRKMQRIQDKAHPFYKKGQYELMNKKFRPSVMRIKRGGC